MHDKELADKVVALGIAEQDRGFPNRFYIPNVSGALFTDELVRDWGVAGALMEKMLNEELLDVLGGRPAITIDDPVRPRDIIEACVEELDRVQQRLTQE